MSYKVKGDSGLSDADVFDIKVLMRSYTDAVRCTQEIAQKDTSTNHYKEYLKSIFNAVEEDTVSVLSLLSNYRFCWTKRIMSYHLWTKKPKIGS